MNAKTQKPNPRSEKIQSASFLIWFISGLYLLGMVWFLLSMVGGYSAQDTPPWLASAGACTVSYGILMVMFWPFENVSPEGRPERPVR